MILYCGRIYVSNAIILCCCGAKDNCTQNKRNCGNHMVTVNKVCKNIIFVLVPYGYCEHLGKNCNHNKSRLQLPLFGFISYLFIFLGSTKHRNE